MHVLDFHRNLDIVFLSDISLQSGRVSHFLFVYLFGPYRTSEATNLKQ